MLYDTLKVGKEHEDKANIILEHILFRKDQPRRIAIFGVPGTGKSEIAHVLHHLLCEHGICSLIWSLDGYYKVPHDKRSEVRQAGGDVGPTEIDFTHLRNQMENKRNYRAWKGVDIIEGLYAPMIETADMNFMIRGTLADTYEFRKDRAKEDPDDSFRQLVLAQEELCVLHIGRNYRHIKV